MWTLKELVQYCRIGQRKEFNGKWVPLRPASHGFRSRIKASWKVLTGKADAFYWPEGQ